MDLNYPCVSCQEISQILFKYAFIISALSFWRILPNLCSSSHISVNPVSIQETHGSRLFVLPKQDAFLSSWYGFLPASMVIQHAGSQPYSEDFSNSQEWCEHCLLRQKFEVHPDIYPGQLDSTLYQLVANFGGNAALSL